MSHRFDPTILREYDIRGIVGQTLSTADARAIGRAYAVTLAEAGGSRVAVCYDELPGRMLISFFAMRKKLR